MNLMFWSKCVSHDRSMTVQINYYIYQGVHPQGQDAIRGRFRASTQGSVYKQLHVVGRVRDAAVRPAQVQVVGQGVVRHRDYGLGGHLHLFHLQGHYENHEHDQGSANVATYARRRVTVHAQDLLRRGPPGHTPPAMAVHHRSHGHDQAREHEDNLEQNSNRNTGRRPDDE
ncbi:hypothetical protein FOWG_17582 [Fusarium oxysporum f. sp. lycopersici MN25]|nr:hypothetical protein FOWG_17582 [Fusarium oxysporum f. sp. lycopersici MN25]